jgi:hypothetical protein
VTFSGLHRVHVPNVHGPDNARPAAAWRRSTGARRTSSPIPALVESQAPICQAGRGRFGWSLAKLRIACFVLVSAAAPASGAVLLSVPLLRWLGIAWLASVAFLMHGLSRRACENVVVLLVDQHGILDRRLMLRHIRWQEIAAICAIDTERSHVVDIELRWPKSTLGKTRWPVRIGAYCQIVSNVPAVSISMLLLDGSVSDFLQAVAQYRPDLLHHSNRKASIGIHP